MPHFRKRHIEDILKKRLQAGPILGVLGQRQVGKTSLAELYGNEYSSLDVRANFERAESDPEIFLRNRKTPFVIDECQLVPSLFPALKEFVRVNKKYGQFILSGSVRFTSRKAIRESLTGRILNIELLPFSLSESLNQDLSQFPEILFSKGENAALQYALKRKSKFSVESLERFIEVGGLPGICFNRSPAIRNTKMTSHLETLLHRDIRQVYATEIAFRTLHEILRELAISQGQPIDVSRMARSVQISPITLKKLLTAYEAIFLIRIIRSVGGRRHPVILFEDQGMASHLCGPSSNQQIDLIRGLFSCVRHQFQYCDRFSFEIIQYRTRGGAFVPFAFQTNFGILGYIPVTQEIPNRSSLMSAKSFIQFFGRKNQKAYIVIAHQGKEFRELAPGILSIPQLAVL